MNEEEDYTRLKKAADLELGIGIEEDKLKGIDHRYYCTHNNPDIARERYDDEWTPTPTPSPEPSGLGCTIDDFRKSIFSGMDLRNENDKEATGETTISPPPPTGLLANTQISDTHHQSSFGFGVSIINDDNYQQEQDEEQNYDNDQYEYEQDEEQDYDNDQYQYEQDEESNYDDREDTDMHEYPNVIGSGQQQHINYSYQLMPNSMQSSVPNINIETNVRVPRTGFPYSDNDQDDDQVMQ